MRRHDLGECSAARIVPYPDLISQTDARTRLSDRVMQVPAGCMVLSEGLKGSEIHEALKTSKGECHYVATTPRA